jgi:uncharacterized protein YdhG (YjbR/CyaY superfamily)
VSTENEVDQYSDSLDPVKRASLSTLRAFIQQVVPEAVETMRYRMPTYEFEANPLCAFASRKQYMSLYIHTRLFEKYKDQLEGLNMGKECIRFRQLEELPLETVRQILEEAARVERA